MTTHSDRQKYCLNCKTHFYAKIEQHEQTYHDDGEWFWVEGSWRDAPTN